VRRADLGSSLLAVLAGGVAVVAAVTTRGPLLSGWVLGLLGVAFAAAAGSAVAASDQPDPLVADVVLVAVPARLLLAGALLSCSGARRPLAAGALLVAGLQPEWEVERTVDDVAVDPTETVAPADTTLDPFTIPSPRSSSPTTGSCGCSIEAPTGSSCSRQTGPPGDPARCPTGPSRW
jgi:hypothetical protein